MERYEIVEIPEIADVDLNGIVQAKQNKGLELVPPILLQPSIFQGNQPIVIGKFILTFRKR